MQLTTDGLKKMAALSVASLKSEGVNLNDSITKFAMDNEMNSEQVKRLVETTNQLAYLSELEDADDRAFEFDVANYDDVLDGMVGTPGLDKQASESKCMSPMDILNGVFSPIEKVAQEKEATIEKWGRNQKIQALKKIASQERNRLEELECNEHDNLVKFAQHRAIVSRDPEALLKMAKFTNGKQMAQLVYGHDKVASEVRRVWRPEDLQHVQALSERLTMCKQAQEEKIALKSRVEKAEEFIKQAFIGAAANAVRSMASKGAGASKGPGMQKVKKVFGTLDTLDTANDVRKGANKNRDVWSSLRG